MLEANPNLTQRDVEKILLMSARQNDQFDESWITNQVQQFVDVAPPEYVYYDLDTDGDGDPDVENAVLPNSEYSPVFQDFLVERGYFANFDANVSLGVPFVYAPDPATDDEGAPIFFDNPEAGPFGFPLPRFRDDPNNLMTFTEPGTDGLLLRATLDPNGVATLSDADDALPIVRTQIRQINLADPDADEDDIQDVEHISMLYDPNGNLVRPFVPALDDEMRVIDGEFILAPDSGPTNGLNVAGEEVRVVSSTGDVIPDPIIVLLSDLDGQNGGLEALQTPYGPFGLFGPQQNFENGAGYTVSQGYGNSLEDVTYGHGVLDAALAVQLAEAWETHDLYVDESITITSAVQQGTLPTRLQPAVNVTNDAGAVVQTVPGGATIPGGPDINEGYYQEYFSDFTTTELPQGLADDGGFVITDAPFYDPDDELNSNRGFTEIPFEFDPSVTTDFLSVEWIEFTTNIVVGDVDHLRLAIRAPDGTQTELNAFRPPFGPALAPQFPQGEQGAHTPAGDPIDSLVGNVFVGGAGDFIDDSDNNQLLGQDAEDALPNGQGYTWTTNRHFGRTIQRTSELPERHQPEWQLPHRRLDADHREPRV